jgi:Major surface glycoprotein
VYVHASAANGDVALDLLQKVDRDVIHRPNEDRAPDGVIVLFDSDATDVDEVFQTCHNLTRNCHNLTQNCHNLTRNCHNLTGNCHNLTRNL